MGETRPTQIWARRAAPGRAVALLLVSLQRGRSECQESVHDRYPTGYPSDLDIGVYWFGHGDETEKATGFRSQFYDPSKKTLIYFHGWAGGNGGWTVGCTRATSRCPQNLCQNADLLADKWLDDGWNVGFFYWDQFADEECTRDAEQKVWFDRGEGGIRWKSFDMRTGKVAFHALENKSVTVGDLCVQSMSSTLKDYFGPEVRFVGHSLGAQLAAKCADLLHMNGHWAAPQRLALLEPFFTTIHLGMFHCNSPTFHHTVGDRLPRLTAAAVRRLWERFHVPTEVYKSSALTELQLLGDPAHQLENQSVLVTYVADWCGEFEGRLGRKFEYFGQFGNLGCRHCAVFPYYFLLYNEPPPKLVGSKPILPSCPMPSSACSNLDIQLLVQRQHLMRGKQSWMQEAGRHTQTLADDVFKLMGPAYMSTEIDLVLPPVTAAQAAGGVNALLAGGVLSILMVLGCVFGARLKHGTDQRYTPMDDAALAEEEAAGATEATQE